MTLEMRREIFFHCCILFVFSLNVRLELNLKLKFRLFAGRLGHSISVEMINQ
jgi:hypothetical protein